MTDQPAGPRERIVDGTAAMERGWTDSLVERNAAKWERRKRDIDTDRRERRGAMNTLELVRHAYERMAKISAVPASSVERGRGGERTWPGPPHQQVLADEPRAAWQEHWDVADSRLLRIHEKLDEYEGLGPAAANTTMIGAEKDRRILAEEGLSPLAVLEKLGRDVAGSPETVRRVRRAAGRSAKDGFRVEQPAGASMTGAVRRVVISEPGRDS